MRGKRLTSSHVKNWQNITNNDTIHRLEALGLFLKKTGQQGFKVFKLVTIGEEMDFAATMSVLCRRS